MKNHFFLICTLLVTAPMYGSITGLKKNLSDLEKQLNVLEKSFKSASPIGQTPTKSIKKYDNLSQFIIDQNPHKPTEAEASNILIDTERKHDVLWIKYDDLRNEDGSVLTSEQKEKVKAYLIKNNSPHANDNEFRLANSNIYVLADNPLTKDKNRVWKYVWRYLKNHFLAQ
jgi:hypothetical protein